MRVVPSQWVPVDFGDEDGKPDKFKISRPIHERAGTPDVNFNWGRDHEPLRFFSAPPAQYRGYCTLKVTMALAPSRNREAAVSFSVRDACLGLGIISLAHFRAWLSDAQETLSLRRSCCELITRRCRFVLLVHFLMCSGCNVLAAINLTRLKKHGTLSRSKDRPGCTCSGEIASAQKMHLQIALVSTKLEVHEHS